MGVDKPNYTQIPNLLLDNLMHLMSNAELRVTLALARETFGYHRQVADVSLSDLEGMTGMSRQGVINGINAGLGRGTIERKEGKRNGFVYALSINGSVPTSQPNGLPVVNGVDYSGAELVNEVDQGSQLGGLEPVNEVDHSTPDLNKEKETIKETPETDPEDAAEAAPAATPWVDFLEAFCWVCHGHKELGALTEKQKGVLTSEAKRVREADFDLDDLRKWFAEKWQKDWRWKKNKERPMPSDVRSMIPSIRDTEPEVATNGNSYHVPGVHLMQPPTTVSLPKPAPPMAHDDPWQIVLAELPAAQGVTSTWLQGSTLTENGELTGWPLYRVNVTHPDANVQWLMQQAEPAIRKKLSTLLRKRILVEFVVAQPETA